MSIFIFDKLYKNFQSVLEYINKNELDTKSPNSRTKMEKLLNKEDP